MTRSIPRRDVELSELTFGSMRMHERGLQPDHWHRLLETSLERGVSTHHASDEYESFPLYCSVLERLRASEAAARLKHVVKLADPHFGESAFDPIRFRRRIDSYLVRLSAQRLDVVQWMWRGDLKQEQDRLAGLARDAETIAKTFAEVVAEGKVGAIMPFPYTAGFARDLLDLDLCDGLTLYVNPLEPELLSFLTPLERSGRAAIALRPLFAGKALNQGQSASELFAWALSQPAVVTGVVSYSSLEHLKELSLEP